MLAIEPLHHVTEGGQRAVVEVGRGVLDVDQRGRVEEAVPGIGPRRVARADVMLTAVDEVGTGQMTGAAGPAAETLEGFVEQ